MELRNLVVDISASIPASFSGKPCFFTKSGDQIHSMNIMLKYVEGG
jgi:4-diphosphocytidyl-2C-methyl-D-erythritol kinase